MANKKGKKVVYWDSCIFLSWLLNEGPPNRTKGEVDGLRECVDKVMKNEIFLVTSDLYKTEVLVHSKKEVAAKLNLLMQRKNIDVIPVDTRVITIATELREYYNKQKDVDGQPGLDVPDSIHLATAIHYGADSFYTFDSGKKRSRNLLSLNGSLAGGKYKMEITTPPYTQLTLELPRYEKKQEG